MKNVEILEKNEYFLFFIFPSENSIFPQTTDVSCPNVFCCNVKQHEVVDFEKKSTP